MTFISDPAQNRTYDPETGWELVRRTDISGGSSGYKAFALEKDGDRRITFWATDTTGWVPPDYRLAAGEKISVWKVQNNFPEFSELIRQALTSYRMAFGRGYDDRNYIVYFE